MPIEPPVKKDCEREPGLPETARAGQKCSGDPFLKFSVVISSFLSNIII